MTPTCALPATRRRGREAMKTQQMQSGQAFFECGATGTVKLADREKYTTECIEGLNARGVRKITEPHGFEFQPRIRKGTTQCYAGHWHFLSSR